MSLGKNASVLLLRSGETIKIDGSLVYEHDLSVGLLNTNRVDGILMDDILLTGREQNVTGIHLNRVVTILHADQNNLIIIEHRGRHMYYLFIYRFFRSPYVPAIGCERNKRAGISKWDEDSRN